MILFLLISLVVILVSIYACIRLLYMIYNKRGKINTMLLISVSIVYCIIVSIVMIIIFKNTIGLRGFLYGLVRVWSGC